MDDGPADPRLEELASLEAIFPEIERPNDEDPFTFVLELPVKPANPVTATFPAAAATPSDLTAAAAAATSQSIPVSTTDDAGPQNQAPSHNVSYLPPVSLRVSLPPAYPSGKPPRVGLHTTPQWIPPAIVKTLEADAARLWEEMGHDMVAFTYIDHIQQAAENAFGMVNALGTLEVDLSHMAAILDHDNKATRAAFESETFDCGVCLDPKKGIACYRMMDCGHVFCLSCLQEFYGDAIKQGDVNVVRCLSPGCAKARETEAANSGKKGRKATASISPGELLAIGIPQDVVSRYVSLKYKKELESDKTTVYCPRKWCDGAAVSKRHKKPRGLELQEPEEDDADDEPNGDRTSGNTPSKTEELLAICEDCAYAFCIRCKQSWHGEFVRCRFKATDEEELSAEELASLEYIRNWTAPCASCDAPVQKTEGCNHMICYRCNTHFCYLCSAWLDPRNPYSHFNRIGYNDCYQRLWDFEGGHGDNEDWRDGMGMNRRAPRAIVRERPHEEPFEVIIAQPRVEERPAEDNARGEDGDGDHGDVGPENVQVEREGPLVLRIDQQRPRRDAPPPPPPPPPPAAPAAPARRGGGREDGQRRGRGGAPAGRQNQGPQQQRAPERQRNGNGARGRGDIRQNRGGHGRRPQAQAQDRNPQPGAQEDAAETELNEQQAAWVRRFVQLALADEEDSGSEDEGLVIF